MTLVHALPPAILNAPNNLETDLKNAGVNFNLFKYFGGFVVHSLNSTRKPDLIIMDVGHLPDYRYHPAMPEAVKAVPHLIIDAYPDARGLKKYTALASDSTLNVIGQLDLNDLSLGQRGYYTIADTKASRLSKILSALTKGPAKSITAQAFTTAASSITAPTQNGLEPIAQKHTRESIKQAHTRLRSF